MHDERRGPLEVATWLAGMSGFLEREDAEVGYGRPPSSTRFQKGRSGNPPGRPRKSRREIPYDHVLGQMVTVLEDGKPRRITAAEAFIMQLTKKGLQGDSASARASLDAIEAARASRPDLPGEHRIVRILLRGFGLGCVTEHLGMSVRRNRTSQENVRTYLKPWIVQAALARIDGNLTPAEQQIVVDATQTPEKVDWPDWWSVRP